VQEHTHAPKIQTAANEQTRANTHTHAHTHTDEKLRKHTSTKNKYIGNNK